MRLAARAEQEDPLPGLGLQPRRFALATLHRPDLVDHDERLAAVLDVLGDRLQRSQSCSPCIRARACASPGLGRGAPRDVRLLDPLSYLEFIALERAARLVVTDSGGVQEETSALGVPCLTYRTTTERPITVEQGTNRLIGTDPQDLASAWREELARPGDFTPAEIPLWDGHAGPRAARAIERLVAQRS